jgi:hypothetical protein
LQLLQPSILAIFVVYCLLVFFLHYKTRDRWVLLMPFYDMCSSLIISPLGIIWYFKTVIKEKHFGYIRPYRHDSEQKKEPIDTIVPPKFPRSKKVGINVGKVEPKIPSSLK